MNFGRNKKNVIEYNSRPRSIALGYFNDDVWLDAVIANFEADTIEVALGDADKTFTKNGTYRAGTNSKPYSIAVAHINSDQHLDIAVAYFGINSIGIFLGTGNGSFTPVTSISTNSSRPSWIH